MHFFFFFWDCCVSQDNSYFDGMIVACRRMINASFLRFSTCHREIRLLMAWSLCVIGWSMPFFFFFLRLLRVAGQFIFWFVIAMFCKAIHPLICNCCISQGNSSFEFWLLHFAKQFVFWFCNCYVSQGNSSFDLQLLHFAITMFRRAIHLLILRLLCFAGQFVF